MAYAAVVSLAQTLDQIMNHHQCCSIPLICEEQLFESLREKLSFLQAFLEDYAQIGGETVEALEGRIRDVAYRAEDMIESHVSDQISSEDDCSERHIDLVELQTSEKNEDDLQMVMEGRTRDMAYRAEDIIESHVSDHISPQDNCCGFKKGLKQLISAIRKPASSLNSCKRSLELELQNVGDLQKVLEQLDSIIEQVMSIKKISTKVEDVRCSYTSAPASSGGAPNDGNKIVGFDEDILALKARLCGESSTLQVISIVGMGGIGKTTLARNIFNDSLVEYHFHTRVWITVSQDYHLREIFLALVASLTDRKIVDLSDKMDEELAEYVYQSLKGRTYLIVMDDMWSATTWDDVRRFYPDDHNGSRVLITTRLTDVAVYASSSPLHQMRFLDEGWSWNLLRDKVFEQQSCPQELERIGRMIAKSCGGLPLALAVVAGVLTKADRTQHHWQKIAKSISLSVATNDDQFSNILTLSYDHLPCHLKTCFLYMGGFPEDYNIPVSKLTKLWVAEGFLKSNGPKTLEELAEEHLEDLVRRNLVLIIKKGSNGKIRFCGLHDLLRDLCIQKATKEEFLHVTNNFVGDIQNQRRLSIHSDISDEFVDKYASASPVRSILFFRSSFASLYFLRGYRLLRVLDLFRTFLLFIPPEITQLFHLRFLVLALAYSKLRGRLMVPPSISKLHNLQTLMIRAYGWVRSDDISFLPFEMWAMPQLRHLIFFYGSRLPTPLVAAPSGGQVLENLQTLCVENFRFTSDAVEMIPNLKKLKVFFYDTSGGKWTKYCLSNLVHLCQLETLTLLFEFTWMHVADPLPASFAFPPNLKKLTLSVCNIPWRQMVIIGTLPNLEVLKLRHNAFIGEKWECSEGEFPRLKFLLMVGLDLKCWRIESTHFPSLECLIIKCCRQLEEIPSEIGDIPTLELIEVTIGEGRKSTADSALRIQEEQRSLGNDLLQVRIRL